MSGSIRLYLRTCDPGNVLTPYIATYNEYLNNARFKVGYHRRHVASVIHFGRWLRAEGLTAEGIDEAVIARFLSEHLPHCACDRPVPLERFGNRAALNHLLRILRSQGVVAQPVADDVARELLNFDSKMTEVWGLSKGTRDCRCRIIRRLLRAQFGSGPVDATTISPRTIHRFVLGDPSRGASAIRVTGGAVRNYLRYREFLGDKVFDLLRAIPTPACWRNSTLPDTLSDEELQQLLKSFDVTCSSRRRSYAIVRCLTDLGLRSSEVASLHLDDIDWNAGVVRLAAGKGRRADVLPLPAVTGEAIADYLVNERPATACRSIFVRHVAPIGEPVGRRVVQRAVQAAYRRCGWNRTRVHILRHTLASRLVNAGTPIKQIADVLRHRSIVTSASYSHVDLTHLSAVALSWPGSEA